MVVTIGAFGPFGSVIFQPIGLHGVLVLINGVRSLPVRG